MKTLYYDRIGISEGIDVNKTSASKDCVICHYWYLFVIGFKFQLDICNGCHDALMMSMKLSDIAILNIQGADYCCNINRISKSEAVNLLQNGDLDKKVIIKKYNFSL